MDDRGFDSIVRSLALGTSRRKLIKGVLGLGGGVVAGAAVFENNAEAARRGFTKPTLPPPPCVPVCDGSTCGGPDGCGGSCGCSSGNYCSGSACCEDIQLTEPSCFWLIPDSSGNWCWDPVFYNHSYELCNAIDECSSGGDCYKWALSAGGDPVGP